MSLIFLQWLFLPIFALAVSAGLCPIYGSVFPEPRSPSSSPSFRTALDTLRSSLDAAFASGSGSFGPVSPSDTYSIQIFSGAEEGSLFEYYHRGSDLNNDTGVTIFDGDAVYRIASTTKLFAVYLLIIESGLGVFNDPVTKYLPELKGDAWEEVTVGALAGYVAGIPADLIDVKSVPGGDLSALFPGVFPILEASESSPCILNLTHCTRAQFLEELQRRPLTYAPNTTPAYSNSGFAILGLILESISGKTWAEALQENVIEPLGLTRTYASTPESSVGVIANNVTFSGWDIDLTEATAMGGMFASANDMSTVGRAILASELLPRATTRAWMKPTAFTSSLIGAVGQPWEIYRASIDADNNRVVDLYTKGGNLGIYETQFALMPDYGVGFIVMGATISGTPTFGVTSLVTDILIPAIEEAAREEADAAFAGSYNAASDINSTLTISSAKSVPGLSVDSWVHNSTDMVSLLGGTPGAFRLQPTNRDEVTPVGENVSSWKMVRPIDFGFEVKGPFGACPTWFGVDRPGWGRWGLDDIVFHLGADGKAESVEIKALKIVLKRGI